MPRMSEYPGRLTGRMAGPMLPIVLLVVGMACGGPAPAQPPAQSAASTSSPATPPAASPAAPTNPGATGETQPGGKTPDPWWVARYDFALEVDGKPSPDACFYQERDSRRILINAPEVPKVCIITQEGMKVTAVDRSKVKVEGDGDAARLTPGAETTAATSTYTVDAAQGGVVFYVGSNRLKILPKQPLVGPTGQDEILRHSPLYRKGIDTYTPEPSSIAYLQSIRTPVEIEVFFGTWCPHCKVLVPKFMKTIKVAANPSLSVSYHGVPMGFGTYDPARSKNVTGIPTFIFWKDGKELGRIPGEPTSGSIEHAVADILRAQLK
ncbi:MAG TPA: thioredoxin family protein [Patescibacteria group bacterium]|nr:thioredoxin family protein [Patescibacteria group bacterium]